MLWVRTDIEDQNRGNCRESEEREEMKIRTEGRARGCGSEQRAC